MALELQTVPAQESSLQSKVDLLDRHALVEQIIHLLNIISENRSFCMFSLEGGWGKGKTFVLDMLCNDLKIYENMIVFRYNCWQYDYYEEPLIAIVSAMMANINEQKSLFSEKVDKGIRTAMGVVLSLLTAYSWKNFDIQKETLDEIISLLKSSDASVKQVRELFEKQKAYDTYNNFNQAMKAVREELGKLSEDKTLFVVVDELDRCLPEYAIKVLERLHHLFEGLDNTAVLLAVDKSQLVHTVEQTFGTGTPCDAYLRKFIDFAIQLPEASINQNFRRKYPEYFTMFDERLFETDFDYDLFLASLFHGIDIRTQETLMRRITTVHRMVFPYTEEKADYITLCSELLWMVLTHQNKGSSDIGTSIPPGSTKCEIMFGPQMLRFQEYATETWPSVGTESHRVQRTIYMDHPTDIPHYLLWYWKALRPPTPGTVWQLNITDEANRLPRLQQVRDLLEIIE